MMSAILLMQSGVVPKVERGGSPDAIKIIPDAFRYQLKRAKI